MSLGHRSLSVQGDMSEAGQSSKTRIVDIA